MKKVLSIIGLAGLALAAIFFGCKKEEQVELPTVTTLSVTEITYNTAKSGGNVTKNGGADIILKGLVWSNQYNPTLEQNMGIKSEGTGVGSFLVDISGLNPDITYYVRAFATNNKGTAYGNQQSFKTLPISVADVHTGLASNISFNSATCSGEITSDGGTIVTSRGLCWSTNEQPTVDSNKLVLGSGTGSFSGSLTGLTAATSYFVRAYGTNSQGTAYGNQQTFSTLGVPYPILTTKGVTNITSTAASTGGNVTNDNGYAITARGVCWNTQPNPTTANNKTSNGSGTGQFTSNIISLTPNTTYYVRAYAINTEGTGYGNELSFTTQQSLAPVVSTTEVSNITYTTATSGGMVSTDHGFAVSARGICYGLQPNPTLADSYTNDGSGVGPYTSYLTGLSQNNTYYVRAYATNSQGTAYGNEVTFSTLQVYTPTVETNDVSNIFESIATCGGNVTTEGGAPVTTRGVCWSTSPFPTTANFRTVNGSGTGTFQSQLTGLSGSTIYYIRAYATNSAGTSYGNQFSFTTLQYYLPTVTTSSIGDIYATTALCGGTVVSDGDTAVISRGVCWNTSSNPTINNSKTVDGSGTGSFISLITGMNGATTYYVRAYATNAKGTAYGNQRQLTTLNPCTFQTTLTDIDGNIYNIVPIGTQCWMKENLKTTKYRNGTSITYPGSNNSSWTSNYTGAYAWYNNDIANKNTYGALYNWWAVNNSSKLCPSGWHVPSDIELSQLVEYVVALGFPNNTSNQNGAGNALKSCKQVNSPLGIGCNTSVHPRWNANNYNYGFDVFFFSGLPGAKRSTNGLFYEWTTAGHWWLSTQSNVPNADHFGLEYNSSKVTIDIYDKENGFSVRCIKD